MTALDILHDVRRQPFEPFRMFVSDGTAYDIRHPDQCMVMVGAVVVALANSPDGVADRTVKIGCDHIVKVIPLNSLPAHGPAAG